jgi:hypothetical protein
MHVSAVWGRRWKATSRNRHQLLVGQFLRPPVLNGYTCVLRRPAVESVGQLFDSCDVPRSRLLQMRACNRSQILEIFSGGNLHAQRIAGAAAATAAGRSWRAEPVGRVLIKLRLVTAT